MFVISDGEPAAYNYHGASAIHDVKQNVSKLENDNFTVIQISIDTVRNVSEMFTNYIDLTQDLSKFPKTLGKIIKKAVVGDKKTIVT
jgi:nitric oxide reductase activation protein